MRSFVFAATAVAATASSPDAIRSFDAFKKAYGRSYATHEENELRHKVFTDNLALIDAENSKGASYKLGVTNFADLTYEEWRSQYLMGFHPSEKKESRDKFYTPLGFVEDDSVDWVAKGAVTPVKNQAQCGSCWSFSTTGALEGASYIAGRGLTSLSEQNILDCDSGGNKCQGGSMDQAFGWVAENGLCSEVDDTYKCADQSSSECTSSTCPTSCEKVLQVGDVTGHTDVDQSEGALEAAVTQQPVSIAIEADKPAFQHYTSGVLTDDACGENLDHGVLLVGYGVENGQKYWKVKNSWGASFGEDGYIRIARGSSQEGGECGVRKAAVFPSLKSASDPADQRFEQFMKEFNREYSSNLEKEYRRKIFKQNVALMEAENRKGKSYTLGITNFADLTHEEWRSQYLTGFTAPSTRNNSLGVFRASTEVELPDSVDWVSQGAVTPVKNQAHCGSCWTFSTTGALEGALHIAGRGLTSLSEQNILDCDKGGNKCQGGSMDQAFTWVAENGICSEADDAYKCADQSSLDCKSSTCPTSCAQVLSAGDVTGHTDVDQTEGALEAAVAQQPVSVAIEADKLVFQHYTGGVLTDDACGENLDHGVLVVGYGVDNGQKYWKVKNSWGSTFGEDGYIRIAKGQTADGGECGIRKMASFPTIGAAKREIIV